MEKIVSDVAVIGAGGAGMAAALTAAEAGARVVILEKRPYPGGTSNTPAGFRSVPKKTAYRDKAFRVHMEMTRWTANADLVRAWIDMSGEIPEWFSRLGIKLVPPEEKLPLEKMGTLWKFGGFPGGYNIGDFYMPPAKGRGHGGAAMIREMVAKAVELGVDIRMGTPARKILKNGDRVTGILAEEKNGRQVQVDAKTVIVATAGFNDDADMIRRHSGFNFTLDRKVSCESGDLFFLCPNLRLTGDGIKMAWEAGAARGAMGVGILPHIPGPGIIGHMPWIMLSQLIIVAEQPYLWVNQKGRRFMDESLKTDHITSAGILARQPGKCAYLIFDEETLRRMESALDYIYFIFPAEKLTDIEGDMRRVMAQGNRHLFIAETLETLAVQMGMDAETLGRTVAQYNSFCDRGHDDKFAKDPKFLHPVRTGKLYALRTYCAAYQTLGGIRVNGRTEALDEQGGVIPGLYAAGDVVVAETYGDPPILGQGTLDFALSSGRVAGMSALAYLEKGVFP
jgi:fumarate reductase flavoprotein subunit